MGDMFGLSVLSFYSYIYIYIYIIIEKNDTTHTTKTIQKIG